jgi:hypothetical protein
MGHHLNGIALGEAWEVGSLVGRWCLRCLLLRAIGGAGDLSGRVVQDRSTALAKLPGACGPLCCRDRGLASFRRNEIPLGGEPNRLCLASCQSLFRQPLSAPKQTLRKSKVPPPLGGLDQDALLDGAIIATSSAAAPAAVAPAPVLPTAYREPEAAAVVRDSVYAYLLQNPGKVL